MEITRATLDALTTGFRKNYTDGFAGVKPMWNRVATRIPSSTSKNTYTWLGDFPGMREWIGDRQIKKFGAHDYSISNREFEQTIGVKRTTIEDDEFGIYAPMFTEMGRSAATHPDELVFGTMKNGFTEACYDGQNFFDTDHPVGRPGEEAPVSNMQGGGGAPWFLCDMSRALKPFIFQERKAPSRLIRKDREEDDNVFMRGEFIYGIDSRCNTGFGFWQMAYASKARLNGANFKGARAAMRNFKNDEGKPLGVNPTVLITGVSNADEAEELLKPERNAAGATNILKGAVEHLVVPWLA